MWLLSTIFLKELMDLGFNGRTVVFLIMMYAFIENYD